MMTSIVAAVVAATAIGPVPRGAPDPCRLLTAAEITASLGSPPSDPKSDGPVVDEELGRKAWSCNQRVGKFLLFLNVIEVGSAAAAVRGFDEMLNVARDGSADVKFTAAPGLGDRAVWSATDDSIMWVTVKGKYLLNVTLAGDVTDPPRFREPLKRLAATALGRLTP